MHRIVVLTVVLAAIGGIAAAASPGPDSGESSVIPDATCAPSPGYLLVPPVGAAVDGRQCRPAVPHAAPALISRPPAAEDTITVLLDAGCSAVMATHAYNLIDSYVLGFALQEVNLQFSNAEELSEVVAQVPADAYPNLARVGGELLASGFDYADEFEFGLDLILDAIGPVLQGA